MSANQQHTPSPFSLPLEVQETPEGPSIRDSEYERIAEVYTERGAVAIVRACNSNAQLVEALENVLCACDCKGVKLSDYLRNQARAALAAAKD